MASLHLLYADSYRITDHIQIRIPTVGEILSQEDEYYDMVSMLTAVPYDMMVELDDAGIDFTKINDWELFLMLWHGVCEKDTSLVFGDLDVSRFRLMQNSENGLVAMVNQQTGAIIDRSVQTQIAATLRKINYLKRTTKKPGNEEAKKYLIKRAREKAKRKRKRTTDSQLEGLITALVNTEEFKYGFREVLDLSIYQFNASLHQVIKKVDYNNLMRGVYAGTIKASEVSPDKLDWLTHK